MDIKYIYDQSNKVNDAYNYILSKIESGEYPQGMLLIERKLCSELEMSRTPVRSALARLASEGELVVYTPNLGMSVRILTEKDIEEIYELRSILDSAALLRFITNASEQNIEEISALTEKLEDCSAREDFEGVALLSGNIHQYILNNCNNTRLSKILSNLLPHIRYMRLQFMHKGNADEINEYIVAFHKKYLNAIKSRNANSAVSILSEHYKIMKNIQLTLLKNN